MVDTKYSLSTVLDTFLSKSYNGQRICHILVEGSQNRSTFNLETVKQRVLNNKYINVNAFVKDMLALFQLTKQIQSTTCLEEILQGCINMVLKNEPKAKIIAANYGKSQVSTSKVVGIQKSTPRIPLKSDITNGVQHHRSNSLLKDQKRKPIKQHGNLKNTKTNLLGSKNTLLDPAIAKLLKTKPNLLSLPKRCGIPRSENVSKDATAMPASRFAPLALSHLKPFTLICKGSGDFAHVCKVGYLQVSGNINCICGCNESYSMTSFTLHAKNSLKRPWRNIFAEVDNRTLGEWRKDMIKFANADGNIPNTRDKKSNTQKLKSTGNGNQTKRVTSMQTNKVSKPRLPKKNPQDVYPNPDNVKSRSSTKTAAVQQSRMVKTVEKSTCSQKQPVSNVTKTNNGKSMKDDNKKENKRGRPRKNAITIKQKPINGDKSVANEESMSYSTPTLDKLLQSSSSMQDQALFSNGMAQVGSSLDGEVGTNIEMIQLIDEGGVFSDIIDDKYIFTFVGKEPGNVRWFNVQKVKSQDCSTGANVACSFELVGLRTRSRWCNKDSYVNGVIRSYDDITRQFLVVHDNGWEEAIYFPNTSVQIANVTNLRLNRVQKPKPVITHSPTSTVQSNTIEKFVTGADGSPLAKVDEVEMQFQTLSPEIELTQRTKLSVKSKKLERKLMDDMDTGYCSQTLKKPRLEVNGKSISTTLTC